jgi:uncharacterized protein (TIGR00725 family)
MSQKTVIGVIGSSVSDDKEAALAEEVGALIAERGAVLVCGGMGGVMESACKGAHRTGGTTVGILPGGDRFSGNKYLDIVIATGLGDARNVLIARSSCGVIAIGGEFGTLSEIAFCLKFGVPVVGLKTWELKEKRFPDGLPLFETPEKAVEAIFQKI